MPTEVIEGGDGVDVVGVADQVGRIGEQPGTGFYWDLKRLDELAYSENVVDLMVRTIARLPRTTQEALRLAAAIGSEFDLGVLATVLVPSAGTATTLPG
ncbi:hypothetical protein [Polyangium sp. 15x6]|uniref:hypothetical protein n=1 Tax=Polyangium sp. 15x6 TaxID=3042687 RepID=UPI00249AB1DF|nr:hypothetical protein [Polyangium sp. 15x6]MDI3291624.1 hypothetical protein [Polyangium sp. 15x6]